MTPELRLIDNTFQGRWFGMMLSQVYSLYLFNNHNQQATVHNPKHMMSYIQRLNRKYSPIVAIGDVNEFQLLIPTLVCVYLVIITNSLRNAEEIGKKYYSDNPLAATLWGIIQCGIGDDFTSILMRCIEPFRQASEFCTHLLGQKQFQEFHSDICIPVFSNLSQIIPAFFMHHVSGIAHVNNNDVKIVLPSSEIFQRISVLFHQENFFKNDKQMDMIYYKNSSIPCFCLACKATPMDITFVLEKQ